MLHMDGAAQTHDFLGAIGARDALPARIGVPDFLQLFAVGMIIFKGDDSHGIVSLKGVYLFRWRGWLAVRVTWATLLN